METVIEKPVATLKVLTKEQLAERQAAYEIAKAKANKYVKNVTLPNLLKAAAQGVKAQNWLDKFLSYQFEKMVPASLRVDNIEKTVRDLIEPHKRKLNAYQHHGLANVSKMQAILAPISEPMIDEAVAEVQEIIATYALEPEQEEKVANAIARYRQFLTNNVLNIAIKELKSVFGVE